MRRLLIHGRARVTEGGAPELLQRLAHTYLGPEVKFPPMADPPPGYITHIAVDRIGGVGPVGPRARLTHRLGPRRAGHRRTAGGGSRDRRET